MSEPCSRGSRLFIALLGMSAGWLLTGCGTLNSGRGWGEHALAPVEWKRLPVAAKHAALDPLTWVPLIGAGVVAAGDWDRDISCWASRETPIFSSQDEARHFSDLGMDVLIAEGLGSGLITPSGAGAGEWSWNKTRGLAVEGGAIGFTTLTTIELKWLTQRERPDGTGNNSMPSGHSATAFSGATLANLNLDYIEMNPHARTGLKAANIAFATSVAWARVEGDTHFPTDVLIGAALGNFVTRFVHDAFLGVTEEERFSIYLEPAMDGGKVFLSWQF